MDGLRLLEESLTLVADQRGERALALLDRAAEPPDPWTCALSAYVGLLVGTHPTPPRLARTDDRPLDPLEHAATVAVAALGAARGDLHDPCLGEAELALLPDLVAGIDATERRGAFVRYLAVEAALAHARLDLAERLMPTIGSLDAAWRSHPFVGVLTACEARLLAFTGHIDRARVVLVGAPRDGLVGCLVQATEVLVAGNATDARQVPALCAEVQRLEIAPTHYLGRGIRLLLAFGLVAIGDVAGAAREVLSAGGADPTLPGMPTVDRALSLELLVAAAVDAGDLDAARAWWEQAQPWIGHRAAAPACHRMQARVSLLAGDPLAAEQSAVRAVEAARHERRAVEAAEGEVVLARARIAAHKVSDATRALRAAVADADREGYGAVRREASRTLRTAGRRLPPVTGAGAASLSAREQDVARLILAGLGNTEIAARLHLSPATVRVHSSRVLAAHGVASRIGLLVAAHREAPAGRRSPTELTDAQARVASRVAHGLTNDQIAAELSVSTKAVEKHVSDVLRRWQVANRFELARRWWDLPVSPLP